MRYTISTIHNNHHFMAITGGMQEDFVGAKFYCLHALVGSNQCSYIREKILELSSTVLSTLSPYLKTDN